MISVALGEPPLHPSLFNKPPRKEGLQGFMRIRLIAIDILVVVMVVGRLSDRISELMVHIKSSVLVLRSL